MTSPEEEFPSGPSDFAVIFSFQFQFLLKLFQIRVTCGADNEKGKNKQWKDTRENTPHGHLARSR